jgi:hypothetical protein
MAQKQEKDPSPRERRPEPAEEPQPTLPAYDEGRVESLHAGRGQGEDEDPRTGQEPGETRAQDPKLSDLPDAFMSSEVAATAGDPKRTS